MPLTPRRQVALIGAGMAGVTCARTLQQAGWQVTLFEKSSGAGGRMASRESPWGSFDHGAQYFTVRDARFKQALQAQPELCRPWSATGIRVLDEHGKAVSASPDTTEAHWVGVPRMNALVRQWAQPFAAQGQLLIHTQVNRIEPDPLAPGRWQLRTTGTDASGEVTHHVHAGFDRVLLALPAPQAQALLAASALAEDWQAQLATVDMAPCWTLMLAFPQAAQPGLGQLGPHWNVARSTHHRVAWLARESSKPQRDTLERWTVQASPAWSREHLEDDAPRVIAKLSRAFAEITDIRAEPTHAAVHRWRYAKTERPLGPSHLWNPVTGLGVCGDWCLGHRVENAYVSGLELALAVI